MDVSPMTLRWFVAIAGPLVLVSYVIGIARAEQPQALWGGIEGSERMLIVPFMFVAAAGFLAYAYIALFSMDGATQAGLRFPWQEADGNGQSRLLMAYALYLIPSMLWLEATLLHIKVGEPWTQWVTIGVLTAVSVGIVLLGLIGWAAHQDGVPGAIWLILGAVAMGIQSIVNDNIIWVWKFPW